MNTLQSSGHTRIPVSLQVFHHALHVYATCISFVKPHGKTHKKNLTFKNDSQENVWYSVFSVSTRRSVVRACPE